MIFGFCKNFSASEAIFRFDYQLLLCILCNVKIIINVNAFSGY